MSGCNQWLCVSYNSQDKLNEDVKFCMNHESIRTVLPEKFKKNSCGDREDTVKFKNMVIHFHILSGLF